VRALALDDEGRYLRDAEVGEVGILAVRGPNLFAGYLEAEHNKGLWIERPGADRTPRRWLNTGDLGRVDGDGFCWLAGRKKELIIRGGHNVDPKTIEEPLHRHPAVALAAAVGYPDAHAGEVPIVYVQLRPGAQATSDELMAHAQRAIGERAAWPKRIEIVEALPLTAVSESSPALTLRAIDTPRARGRAAGATLDVLEARPTPGSARCCAGARTTTLTRCGPGLRATFRLEELAAPQMEDECDANKFAIRSVGLAVQRQRVGHLFVQSDRGEPAEGLGVGEVAGGRQHAAAQGVGLTRRVVQSGRSARCTGATLWFERHLSVARRPWALGPAPVFRGRR
jgi:hypothetical protein